jgi:hypothetical protein
VLQHEAQEDMLEMFILERQLKQICLMKLDVSVAGRLNAASSILERRRGYINGNNSRAGVA